MLGQIAYFLLVNIGKKMSIFLHDIRTERDKSLKTFTELQYKVETLLKGL